MEESSFKISCYTSDETNVDSDRTAYHFNKVPPISPATGKREGISAPRAEVDS